MNRDTPAGKASVKHLCEVFGVSRQAYHKALQTPAIAPELPPVRRQSRWLTAEEASNASVFPAALHNAARIVWPAPVHGEANLRPEAHRQWRGGPGGPWVGLPAGPDQPGATLARLAL